MIEFEDFHTLVGHPDDKFFIKMLDILANEMGYEISGFEIDGKIVVAIWK